MEPVLVITQALEDLAVDMLSVIPKLVIALVIWYVGKYLLGFTSKLVKKLDLKGTKADDKAISTIVRLITVVGQVLLVLIILDYLGIGRTVVGAITNGLTFAVAIALGLAFGKALEDDAQSAVKTIKSFLNHK